MGEKERKEKKRKEQKKKKTLDQLLWGNVELLFMEVSAISEAQKSEASILGQKIILILALRGKNERILSELSPVLSGLCCF